jgi:ribonucleotide reductase beta subunit family protein with ferritin-like domain
MFATIEGILFSGAFCTIFWLKQHGILPGLCLASKLISHDEGIYCDLACIRMVICDAVNIEHKFLHYLIPIHLLGMTMGLMCQYIKLCADCLMVALLQPHIYGVTNPFPWMTSMSLQGKTNSFEKCVSEYSELLALSSLASPLREQGPSNRVAYRTPSGIILTEPSSLSRVVPS